MTENDCDGVKRRSGQSEDALFTLKPGVYLFIYFLS